jgi:hypothetical protein
MTTNVLLGVFRSSSSGTSSSNGRTSSGSESSVGERLVGLVSTPKEATELISKDGGRLGLGELLKTLLNEEIDPQNESTFSLSQTYQWSVRPIAIGELLEP